MRAFTAIAALSLLALASPVVAQDSHANHADHAAHAQAAEAGQYEAGLRRMLEATAAGTCPDDVMAADLLSACQGQIAAMAPQLAALGAVTTVTFLGAEETSAGRLESYKVDYAGGISLTWAIGGLADGKYSVAFTRSA